MVNVFYILIFFVFCQPIENSILWSDTCRLEWSDFKGRPDLYMDAAALTASGLSMDLKAKTTKTSLIEFKVIVEARFYPDQSWYKKELASSQVLAHEQLHFDITELHARKLRERIDHAELTINIKKEISLLSKTVNQELKVMQKEYDRDSNYSRNNETQIRWQNFVSAELYKLSKYK